MSAPAVEISRPVVPLSAAGPPRRGEQIRPPATTPIEVKGHIYDADGELRARGLRLPHPPSEHPPLDRKIAPTVAPTPCRGSPPALGAIAEPRRAAQRVPGRHLDRESQAWVEALHSIGLRRDEAIRRLYKLLYREARFEVRRRAARLAHPSGGDLDDLAVQAADDAVVAILAKLDQFRGDSLFTTWARRFAQYEAPAKLRRRLGRGRELPMELEFEHAQIWPALTESPHERCVARDAARTLTRLIAEELTAHQREVLIAVAIHGVATEDLARRLDTTSGAIYKTLHDARRKLKAGLLDS
jgi:RNA polymerase sigma-70 factor (ECF subfamily)